mmetsp:Transcript_8156/g.8362  ORF Transcript_8156/g.8362 Transcript_8156/m.8362 type:complete len:95 (+) Transcript_8156:339-623(+)
MRVCQQMLMLHAQQKRFFDFIESCFGQGGVVHVRVSASERRKTDRPRLGDRGRFSIIWVASKTTSLSIWTGVANSRVDAPVSYRFSIEWTTPAD